MLCIHFLNGSIEPLALCTVVLFTLKNCPENSQKNPIKLRAHKGPVQGRAELQLFAACKAKYKIFNV